MMIEIAGETVMDLEYDYSVLGDMLNDFDSWFPFDEDDSEEEREMYRDGFARAKLVLELGEYSREDLEFLVGYLESIAGIVVDNDMYYDAINDFIYALSWE